MDASNLSSIIVALISAAGSIFGANLAVRKKAREDEIKDAVREQRQLDLFQSINEKIERLEKKVDTHNGYAEKFAETSKNLAVIAKEIEYLKGRP
jgi:hypothetical protein|nr:MAG TPA: hypothetical protein [Caudoviricetes sp.]